MCVCVCLPVVFDGREEFMGFCVSCVLSSQVPLKSGPDVTPWGGPSGPALLGCGWPQHASALWSGWHHQQSGVTALEVGPRCWSVTKCLHAVHNEYRCLYVLYMCVYVQEISTPSLNYVVYVSGHNKTNALVRKLKLQTSDEQHITY